MLEGEELWGEEEDAMFEQQAYNPDIGNQIAAQTAYKCQPSEEIPVSYPEPEWKSEEEKQKWLKEKEKKSAKFEEIARKRGIQIVDPKSLESNDNNVDEESSSQFVINEMGDGDQINKIYHDDAKPVETLSVEHDVDDRNESFFEAVDMDENSSRPLGSIIESLSIPDRCASPVHDVARRIVLAVNMFFCCNCQILLHHFSLYE